MRRLESESDLEELLARIAKLAPDASRQWGRMSCPQMVCHLGDAFRGPLGERRPSAPIDTLFTRTVLRWVALGTPVPWPRGRAQTTREIDQVAGGGTRPGDFSQDIAALVDLIKRFTAQQDTSRWPPHPIFGRLSEREWRRWGWAHSDHHLRQFGL